MTREKTQWLKSRGRGHNARRRDYRKSRSPLFLYALSMLAVSLSLSLSLQIHFFSDGLTVRAARTRCAARVTIVRLVGESACNREIARGKRAAARSNESRLEVAVPISPRLLDAVVVACDVALFSTNAEANTSRCVRGERIRANASSVGNE